MKQVTYEDAMKFLDLLKEKLPYGWSDDYEPEIEYIKEMLWRYEDMRNS